MISQTVAEIWQFFDFFKVAATAILDFKNFEILTVGRAKRVKMRLLTKFRGDRLL